LSEAATSNSSKSSVRALDCPACGGTLEMIAAGFTTNITCQYCGSELDTVDPEIRLIARHQEAAAELELPLGTRGKLRGIEWATIGYMRRSDYWEGWDEYLLFNPFHGYRWLTRTGAGWSFGTPLMKLPNGADQPDFQFSGKRFKSFNADMKVTTDYVLGEFYWRARKGDQAVTSDYVGGNKMLTEEISRNEISWTMGEWISFAEMHAGFGTPKYAEWPATGAAPMPHQPSPYTKDLLNLTIVALVFAALAMAIAIYAGLPSNKQSVAVDVNYNRPSQEWTLGPLTVTGSTGIVTVETSGKVASNSYVDFDYRLVERTTGQQIGSSSALEQYNGRDSEGSWTEEVNNITRKFAGVPAGTYDLEIEANPAPNISRAAPAYNVVISAYTGGLFVSNYMLFLLLLFGPVIWLFFKQIRFAQHKYSESDAAEDDDD